MVAKWCVSFAGGWGVDCDANCCAFLSGAVVSLDFPVAGGTAGRILFCFKGRSLGDSAQPTAGGTGDVTSSSSSSASSSLLLFPGQAITGNWNVYVVKCRIIVIWLHWGIIR